MKYFIHNLETDKLNIFTGGKSEWMSLPEAQRDEIKRFCLWSRNQECWVSKSKADSAYWLLKTLKEAGFEDRGKEGERLTFAEQVEAKQDRAAERAERMEDRADAASDRSQAAAKRSHDMLDAIPMGQPILVGHHSEKRDRNYRDRAWNLMGKAVEEGDKAKHYSSRAVTARATAEGAQYSNPAYLDRHIKECQKEIGRLERCLSGKRFGTVQAERQYAAATGEPVDRTVTDADRERWTELLEQAQDKLGFFQHCLDTCGKTVFNKETLKGKAEVKIRGRWEQIVRLNPTTVAIPNICFPDPVYQRKWALKYAYAEVQEAR